MTADRHYRAKLGNISANEAVRIAQYQTAHRPWYLMPRSTLIEPNDRTKGREANLEMVTVNTLKTIERFLRTGRVGYMPAIDGGERSRLFNAYVPKEAREFWGGSFASETLPLMYAAFVAKFPEAEKYGSFKALQYAAQYGDTPCKVYKESNETDATE